EGDGVGGDVHRRLEGRALHLAGLAPEGRPELGAAVVAGPVEPGLDRGPAARTGERHVLHGRAPPVGSCAMPPEPDDAPLPWRAHWPAVALAVAGALVALWSKAVVFPHLSWNRDEPVYLWQMEVLRSGRLAAPDGGHPDLFLPWLSAARDGELFGQYTIGWPLVLLVARVLTGSTAPALALGAALAVAGTYALAYELLRRRAVAVAAGGPLLASPILALQAGVHLTYLFTLGLGLLFGALLRSGLRRQRPGRLVAAGVLLGGVFLTRPYDAVVWGGVFAAWSLLEHRARWRPVVPRLVVVGAGALPLVAVGLWVNHRLTGSPVEFAMTVKDPLDTFGFGERRLMPSFEPVDYTPYQALRSSAKNGLDRKSTRLNSSHVKISYAVF